MQTAATKIDKATSLRREIVHLMKVRATLTGKSHAAEWRKVDRKITALQLRVDALKTRKD